MTQLKKRIYLKLIALCRLFDVQLSSFSRCAVLFRRATKKLSDFFFLNGLAVLLAFMFWCFLNVICYSIQKNGNSVVVGFVLSSEVRNYLILVLSLECVVLEYET